jgi:hypothetical protein
MENQSSGRPQAGPEEQIPLTQLPVEDNPNYFILFRLLFFRVELISLLWTFSTFFIDFISEAFVIGEYYKKSDRWYGSFTIVFRVIPAIIIAIFSFINYYQRWKFEDKIDKANEKYQLKKNYSVDSKARFIFRMISLLLNPIARYWQLKIRLN